MKGNAGAECGFPGFHLFKKDFQIVQFHQIPPVSWIFLSLRILSILNIRTDIPGIHDSWRHMAVHDGTRRRLMTGDGHRYLPRRGQISLCVRERHGNVSPLFIIRPTGSDSSTPDIGKWQRRHGNPWFRHDRQNKGSCSACCDGLPYSLWKSRM